MFTLENSIYEVLQQLVYRQKTRNREHVNEGTVVQLLGHDKDLIDSAKDQWPKCITAVTVAQGGYTEHRP